VVAALEHQHEAPLRVPIGEIREAPTQRSEPVGGDPHAAERITRMCVEAGRHEHELRAEVIEGGQHEFVENRREIAISERARERQMERVPAALGEPALPGAPGAGIERRRAVGADEGHVAAAIERVGGAVALVNIPVDDGHPREAQRLSRVFGGDRHVVEHTEAHRARVLGMVTGRTHQRERSLGLARHDRPHGLDGRPRREVSGIHTALRERGVGVQIDRQPADALDLLDVPVRVHPLHLGPSRRPCARPVRPRHGMTREESSDRREPRRRLGMPWSGIVPCQQIVGQKHGRPPVGFHVVGLPIVRHLSTTTRVRPARARGAHRQAP
jgi:hypothetical protein